MTGATSYDLQFDNDTPINVTGTTWNLVSNVVGGHTWRVRAKNATCTSAWSATRSFSIELPVPILVAPEDGATVYADVSTPFSWTSVTGATSYDLQFDNDTPINVTGTTWNLISNVIGAHTWKVRARNMSGAGSWSNELMFTIEVFPRPLTKDSALFIVPCLVGELDAAIPAIVTKAVNGGFDKIYIQVFESTGPGAGQFMISDETNGSMPGPSLDFITLSDLVQAAHEAGIHVIGVLSCFPEKTCGGIPTNVSPDLLSHSWYLSDSVIQYLLYSFTESGQNVFDLDGIGLDYVRYSGPPTAPDNVTTFVMNAKAKCRETPLHAFIACWPALVDNAYYTGQWKSYETLMNDAVAELGQNWPALATYLDYAVAMTFAAEGEYSLPLIKEYVDWTLSCLNLAIAASGNPMCRAISGVRTWDERVNADCTGDAKSTTTPESIRASIIGGHDGGADGYFCFRYGTAVSDYNACFVYPEPEAWWDELKLFNDPGGDFPVAVLRSHVEGLEITFDASGSHDAQTDPVGIEVRWDWDYDADVTSWDTPWVTEKVVVQSYPSGHQRMVALQVRDADGLTDIVVVAVNLEPTGVHDDSQVITSFSSLVRGRIVHLVWILDERANFGGSNILRSEGAGELQRINHESLAPTVRSYHDSDVLPGRTYRYQLEVLDLDGRTIRSLEEVVTVPEAALLLEQNYPNPFNPATTIGFYVPHEAPVILVIYDTAGRRIRTLLDRVMLPGIHQIIWDGTSDSGQLVSSGIYYCRLEAGKATETRKLVLMK